jgi:hypothetical protein
MMLMSILASSEELLFITHSLVTAFRNYSSLGRFLRLYRSGGCFPDRGYTLVRTALDEISESQEYKSRMLYLKLARSSSAIFCDEAPLVNPN